MDEESFEKVAEAENRWLRWGVGDDKVLLRMFYEDMGIHAIKKQLQRSYLSIYQRIRSITLPEEVLKGREFEDFVLELFDIREDGEFILLEWQGDKKHGDVSPESNRYPDFVFSYLQSHFFAVECKWRERLKSNIEKDLFATDKLAIYQKFADERKMPVFIVLGIGGIPSQPESLYVIPLAEISAVVDNNKSIVNFLRSSTDSLFQADEFISSKEKMISKKYTLEEKRTIHPNAYLPWVKKDDERLVALFDSGKSVHELTTFFRRSEGAVKSRLRKLGKEI